MCAQVLPPWLTTVLLSLLLGLLAAKLIHRGVLTFASESRQQALEAHQNEELNAALEAPLLPAGQLPDFSGAIMLHSCCH